MTRKNQQFGYSRRTVIASMRVLMCIVLGAPVVAQAAEYIYWADYGNGVISRANLDGTGKQDLVTGLGDLGEIVVVKLGSSSSGQAQEIVYVPFPSTYMLMALVAALGGRLVMRRR